MDKWINLAMAPMQKTGGSAEAGAAQGPMGSIMSLLPLIIIFILFYVLFIVPQRKQQKQQDQMRKSLAKGDEVITTSGMFGKIAGFNEKEDTVYLKMADNVKVELQKSAIAGLRKADVKMDEKASKA